MATHAPPPTPKGVRQAEAIVEAAIVCLARDGYAAASMQRIADEAGLSKRLVVYYFSTREALFEQVILRIADRLVAQVGAAISGLEDPEAIVSVGFDRMWAGFTSDPALLAAYYGLISEAVTSPELRSSTRKLTDGFRELLDRVMDDVQAGGRVLLLDRDVLAEIVLAGFHGLQLAWLERGDTPALAGAIAGLQEFLASQAPAAR